MSWQSGFQMRVIEGPDEHNTTLDFPRMTIGRARAAGSNAAGWILIYDKAVSRQHAELSWDEKAQTFCLRHLSKTNFTWVDDEPVDGEILLRPGQRVKVGGTIMLFEASSGEEAEAETDLPTAVAEKGELTERLSLGQLAAAVSLRQGEQLHLAVIDGVDKGKQVILTGFYLTVGRANLSAEQLLGGNSDQVAKFDQMVEMTDPNILPNHLILKWDELRQGFGTWKNPQAASVPVFRKSDGFEWQSVLTDAGGLIRKDDKVKIGDSVLMLRGEEAVSEQTVQPLSL